MASHYVEITLLGSSCNHDERDDNNDKHGGKGMINPLSARRRNVSNEDAPGTRLIKFRSISSVQFV